MNFPKPITDEELEYFARLRERDYLQFRDKWPDVFINVLERLLNSFREIGDRRRNVQAGI